MCLVFVLKFTHINNKTDSLRKLFLFFFLTCLTGLYSHAQERKFLFTEQKMGSPFNLVLVTDDSLKAAMLARECFALVDTLNSLFSDYDSTSELSRLNASAGKNPMMVSSRLWNLLISSGRAWQLSNHSFDITIGPLSRLWRKARKAKSFPDSLQVREQKKLVGFQQLRLNPADRSVYLPQRGMLLDLGGIAKGYVAQEVVNYLTAKGITRSLADAGGDMVMSQAPPNSRGWTIGVNIPETTDELLPKRLLLQNKAVATSGDAYQYIEHQGKKHSHIADPRTGYGITSQRNVTVIADNGALADWLATACSILSVKQAKELAIRMKAEVLITEIQNNQIIYQQTAGFGKYWKRAERL
jgi:thiamine biosynthesis lipoprotein